MATRIPTAAQNAACDAIVDLIDAGATAGEVEIRTGAQPASANDAASGTLLVTIPLNDPAFGAAAAGVATADIDPALTGVAVAAGIAGWFRVLDDVGATVMDGACAEGSGEMDLDNTDIAVDQNVTITSWTSTMPAG